METNTVSQYESAEQSLEIINDASEEAIKGEYLAAQLHGPHWALGLDGKVV